MSYDKRLVIALDDDMHKRFKVMAAEKGKNYRELIGELFEINELMKDADSIIYLASSLLKTPDALDKREVEVGEFFDKVSDYVDRQVEFCATWRMDDLLTKEELEQVMKHRKEGQP